MSETTLIDEPKAPQNDVVVDLGTASEQTRGVSKILSFVEPNANWPYLFYR